MTVGRYASMEECQEVEAQFIKLWKENETKHLDFSWMVNHVPILTRPGLYPDEDLKIGASIPLSGITVPFSFNVSN